MSLTASNKLAKNPIKWEMHIEMIYDITTFI